MIVDIYQYVSVCLSIDLYLYVYLYCVALFHLISLFDVILPINFLLCQLGKFWGNAPTSQLTNVNMLDLGIP